VVVEDESLELLEDDDDDSDDELLEGAPALVEDFSLRA